MRMTQRMATRSRFRNLSSFRNILSGTGNGNSYHPPPPPPPPRQINEEESRIFKLLPIFQWRVLHSLKCLQRQWCSIQPSMVFWAHRVLVTLEEIIELESIEYMLEQLILPRPSCARRQQYCLHVFYASQCSLLLQVRWTGETFPF